MAGRTNLNNINYSQLVLIPKNKATTVREYRPIALLNSSLKIPLLPKHIGDYQSNFIKGPNILEGWLRHMKSYI